MEVIRIIKDESLIFGKTGLDISSSIDPNDVTSFVPTKVLETKEVNLGGWYVDIEATLSEKSKVEQDYILLVNTKSKGVQPFRVHNKEVKKRRVLARAHHVMFDSELYVVEDYSADKLGTLAVLNGLNNNLDRPSPYTFTVSHAGSTTMDFSGMTLLEAWEHLVDNKAALVEADWYRMYFRNELGRDRGVTISHGKDLEDIVGTEDWSTVVTKIYPYTSGGVTLPEKYLMSEVQYNRPYTRRVEIAVDVDAIKEQSPEYSDEQLVPLIQEQLRSNAERHLEESQYPQVTYRVSSNVAEDLDLWDKILVKHPAITYNLPLEGPVDQEAIDRLGIPTKVLAYQYDVIAKRTVKLDYGDFYANFSKLFNNKLDKITEEWKRVENNLEQRLDAQTELINNWNKKGHMVILENEILFLDKLPMGDADNVLRIGLGGIAFSQTGVDGNFTSAWDLEGNFNTDFIGAGQIRTNHLASDVGSSLDLSSNESVNIMVTDKVVEEVDKIELPPGPPGKDGDEWEIGPNGNWFKNGVDTGIPSQGPQGIPGQDGTSLYTWVKYADTPTTGMSDDPTGKRYVGFAYNNTTQTESANYSDYDWQLVKGEDGLNGQPGEDGKTYYNWIAYADTPSGGGISLSPTNKDYVGYAFNKETQTPSLTPGDYQWQLVKGEKGDKGDSGEQGPRGATGTSVESVTEYYLATASSTGVTTSTNGWSTSIQTMTATNKYLWNYEKINFSDSTSQPTIPVIIGVYGDKGQTGSTGATGRSIVSITEHYLATSANSGVTRSTSGWGTTMQPTTETNKYLWNYETINWSSGTTPTYVEPIIIGVHGAKGDKGDQGPQGIQGPKGANGTSQYIHIRYSTASNGNPMTPTPSASTRYIGIANTTSSTAPTGYASYTWSLYKGEKGDQGIQGPAGANGQPTYTWVKYADTPTSGMDDSPDGKKYIGLAFNKTTQTESTSYSQYQWSLMPQNIEIGGRNYAYGLKFGTFNYNTGSENATEFNKITPLIQVVPGEKYVISLSGYEVGEVIEIRYIFRDSLTGVYTPGHAINAYLGEVTIPSGCDEIKIAYGRAYGHTNTVDFDKVKLKFEKGNIATDWTPAPEDVQNEITRVETETTAKITANTEAINLEYSQRIEEYGTLSDSVSENTRLISANTDGIKTLVEDTITDIQGQINSSNERLDSVDESVQTFSSKITDLEGDMEEQQTFFRTGLDGLTIGGTDWETVMHANGERISFQSQTGNVQAHFGANGMYSNRWELDFHVIEKFEEGNVRGTIYKNRKGGS